MKQLSVFSRFVAVWKPSFLKSFLKEKGVAGVWKFWFFWTVALALIATIFLSFAMKSAVEEVIVEMTEKAPEFEITLQDGVLSTKNIPEPLIYEDGEEVFILDTSGAFSAAELLKGYDKGVAITDQEALSKKNQFRSDLIPFSEIEGGFSLSKEDVLHFMNTQPIVLFLSVFAFCFLVFVASFFSLLSALWWAFLVWLVGDVMLKIKGFTFSRAYLLVLQLYIPVMIIDNIVGMMIPFASTLLFTLFAGMNFWDIKNNK
ncbi:hypothetical protein COB57_03605 [Candidatus Peregrinibacteria bacterium]|nr:MAG: hypothetical protein COB57_03605 [Candidatus Peregrinibacteria bacterium]